MAKQYIDVLIDGKVYSLGGLNQVGQCIWHLLQRIYFISHIFRILELMPQKYMYVYGC